MSRFGNDQTIEQFKEISDKDFGSITNTVDVDKDVNLILNKKD
jgi:hypothetical protein